MKRSYPILLYHHVSPDREVTPPALEAQLRHLLNQGYRSLSLEDLLAITSGSVASDEPGFAVTFDDGYADNWSHAFPILQKLNVKATMYLVSSRVEDHSEPRPQGVALDTRTHEREPGGFLSWAEARVMQDSGLVRFGSHTHTHRYFIRRSRYENLEMELNRSRECIETKLGRPCADLAWPWGDYETAWIAQLQKSGYRSAMTTLAGSNTQGTSAFKLRRLGMRRGDLNRLKFYLSWNQYACSAALGGFFYGWDRRFKQWWHGESPYPHG